MNDRELLELAADGAGINWIAWSPDKRDDASLCLAPNGKIWNSLKSDGDAFQLYVALRMKVEVNETSIVVWLPQREDGETPRALYEYPQAVQDDAYTIRYIDHLAATRRAITRAAAEVGKEKR